MVARTFTVAGKPYPLLFSTNAGFLIDVYLRQHGLGNLGTFMAMLTSGNAQLMELMVLFWACLEGGRKKENTRPEPFTIDEAGELIDRIGGITKMKDELLATFNESKAVKEPAAAGGPAERKNEDSRGEGGGSPTSKQDSE